MAEPDRSPSVIRLRNHLAELDRLHDFVSQFCLTAQLAPDDTFALSLALDELVTNVIVHGYDGHAEHEILVTLSLREDVVIVEMEDDARPFDPTQATAADLSADLQHRPIGGLGLHFVRRTMDEVVYRRDGRKNHLRMLKRTAQLRSDHGSQRAK